MATSHHNPAQLLVDDGPRVTLHGDQIQRFKPGAIFNLYESLTPSSTTTSTYPHSSQQQQNGAAGTSGGSNRVYLGGPISSMDFHASGSYALASTLHHATQSPQTTLQTLNHPNYQFINPAEYETQIHLFNATRGTRVRVTKFDRYYVDMAKFTHNYSAILHSGFRANPDVTSNTANVSLGYTSLVDGAQLQEFVGHSDKIVSISLNPVHDSFISTSLDRSIRLYDLRSNLTQGLINATTPTLSAIDPSGVVFAIACHQNCLKLYDFRTFETGPFSTFWLSNLPPVTFTSITFSPDGSSLIVSCTPLNSMDAPVPEASNNANNNTTLPTQNNPVNNNPNPNSNQNINNPNNNQNNASTATNPSEQMQDDVITDAAAFSAFNYVLIIDAFNGQIIQRISSPRNTYPLDKDTLTTINVDKEMISYAPVKAITDTTSSLSSVLPVLPSHYGKPTHPMTTPNNISGYTPTYDVKLLLNQLNSNNNNNNDKNNPNKIQQQNAQAWLSYSQIQHPLLDNTNSSTTTPVSSSITNNNGSNVINTKYYNLPQPNTRVPCSMTADCKFLTFGTHVGTLPTHDTRTGRQLTTFTHKRQSPISHAQWNPTRTQLLTADAYEMCFWVPTAK